MPEVACATGQLKRLGATVVVPPMIRVDVGPAVVVVEKVELVVAGIVAVAV